MGTFVPAMIDRAAERRNFPGILMLSPKCTAPLWFLLMMDWHWEINKQFCPKRKKTRHQTGKTCLTFKPYWERSFYWQLLKFLRCLKKQQDKWDSPPHISLLFSQLYMICQIRSEIKAKNVTLSTPRPHCPWKTNVMYFRLVEEPMTS